MRHLVLGLCVISALLACSKKPTISTPPPFTPVGTPLSMGVKAFLAQVEPKLLAVLARKERAEFEMGVNVTPQTEAAFAKAQEELLAYLAEVAPQAKAYLEEEGAGLTADIKRKLYLMGLLHSLPSPKEAKKRTELVDLAARMDTAYDKAEVCTPGKDNKKVCYGHNALEKQMQAENLYKPATFKPEAYQSLLEVWEGWHNQGKTIGKEYPRFVELANEGARSMGYHDLGEFWRAGYDMSPAALEQEVERLWKQVEPLYKSLHCYVRGQLSKRYGADKVSPKGPIPAHLLGNMWAQEWGSIYPLVAPPSAAPEIDLTELLRTNIRGRVGQKAISPEQVELETAKELVRMGERFYTSLGLAPLPKTFWDHSLFLKPKDRTVQCHASAQDIGLNGELRLKMCINVDATDFHTVHHELGHNFYYDAYKELPAVYQNGANDGFHEGLGDAIALSITPGYLKKIGLTTDLPADPQADLRQLLRSAMSRVAFLPFGYAIDKWRWDVFAGKITPAQYNQGWWELRKKYQGVSPVPPRPGTEFDAASKYHVPANVPYLRYFLARILQFQFHKGLCAAAGHKGPLHQCSIYGSKEAGDKLQAMMKLGSSRPWPEALALVSGENRMDAGALLEYYKPLQSWLEGQNKGQTCGW